MAAPLPPPRRRRRPRRGSLARPVNARLYRGAFLFAVLPLVFLAFTVSSPAPLAKPLLPETFDTAAALTLARALADDFPDRSPGSPGAGDAQPAAGATAWFEQQLRPFGLALSTSTWAARIPGRGRVELTNVAAVAGGQTKDTIVVMAHRDNTGAGPGADDDASGTGVLIELARANAQPRGIASSNLPLSVHRLVFLSTDGDAYGQLGVRHFIATYPYPIDAVINLDAVAGAGAPRIVTAGERPRSPDATLVATAAARIAEQTGRTPVHDGVLGQLIDLGFPFTLYGQGPFLAAGISAITLTTAGDRPPAAFGDSAALLQGPKLAQMGEASQELVASLDQDVELAPSSASEVWVGGRTIRGWAIELLLISLLMPVAVTIVDLYALCRRHRISLAPAVRALRSRLGFWLFAGIVFTCFRLLGAWPTGPGRPPDPGDPSTTHWPALPLVALVLVIGLGWAVARKRLVVRRPVTSEEQLAGYLSALIALLLVALLVAATNPFALLFVLPALHVWLWLPQVRIARPPVRVALFLAGLVGPALILVSLATRFGLGLDAPWYLLQLVASGWVSTLAVVLALAAAAAASQLAAASAGRYSPYPSARERGPRGPVRDLVGAVGRTVVAQRQEVALRRAGRSYSAR